MLVRPRGKKTLQLRINKLLLKLSVSVLLLIVMGIGAGVYYTTNANFKLSQYNKLKTITSQQDAKIKAFTDQVDALEDKMKDILQREADMQDVLGKKRRRRRRRSSLNVRKFQKKYRRIARKESNIEIKIQKKLDFLREEIVAAETRVIRLSRQLEKYKDRFATTPSIWPLYGRVLYRYGWRVHPKTGRSQFHKGVDIPAWIGAPVKTTADGIVEFSGWGGGYGWLIIVGHDYGYRTMYAHLSEVLVNSGQPVKKGEIIGKIGESGITTGPHLHYEIKRWRRSVSPNSYLGLDMFTAVTKLW